MSDAKETPQSGGTWGAGEATAILSGSDSTLPASIEDFSDLPERMRAAQRWLVWRFEGQNSSGKPRKVPYYINGRRRSGLLDGPEDVKQLATFEAALTALQTEHYSGLGFALGLDGGSAFWQGIDLDDLRARPALATLSDDLPGYTETSPSGNGRHAIGYGRAFPSLGSNASGIEAYAGGRFFTVTGEGAGLGDIADLADFVETVLRPLHQPRDQDCYTATLMAGTVGEPCPGVVNTVPAWAPEQTLRELRGALAWIPSDDRDLWVKIGHALKTLGDLGRGLWMEWSQSSEKFDPAGAGRTWRSFQPGRTGHEVVFAEAQRRGWPNPMAGNGGASSDRGAFQSQVQWFDLQQWRASDRYRGFPPPRQMLVDGVFPMAKPSLVAAAGGVGKSFSLLHLAYVVSLQSPKGLLCPFVFGGMVAQHGAAVVITSEDDVTEVHGRLSVMGDAPPQLYVVSLPDAGGVRPLFQADRAGVVASTPAWGELTRQLAEIPNLKLVVLDPLQPMAACDLNKPEAAQAVCSCLAELAASTGAAVIVSHHFSKARDIDSPAQAREAVRGSGALVDGVRCAYALWPAKAEVAKSTCSTLGIEFDPDRVVMGAVVKSNGRANRDVRIFVRDTSGLLRDSTIDVLQATPTRRELLPELTDAIALAAREGKPYTKTGAQGVYARRFEMAEAFHAIGKHRMEGWVDDLLSRGEIVQAACGGAGVKWLDIPAGDVAKGTAIFVSGHVSRAVPGRHQMTCGQSLEPENA